MEKEKVTGTSNYILKMVLILVLVMVLVTGATYSIFLIGLVANNGDYTAGTTCFDVTYDVTNDDGTSDITGTLSPSATDAEGLTGNVTIGLDPSCNVDGEGNIYLNIDSTSSKGTILVQTVEPHCENFQTLETLTRYTTSSECTAQENAIWVTNGTALKYAVYEDGNEQAVSVGYVDRLGEDIAIYSKFEVPTEQKYNIYIWLDGHISDSTYASIPVSGQISADVQQITEPFAVAVAVYSADDHSLRFYKTDAEIIEGESYNGREATAVFTGFETAEYEDETFVPWYGSEHVGIQSIESVYVEDTISPLSTAYWFRDGEQITYIDLSKLDTSNVTTMAAMFSGVGSTTQNQDFFESLSNWNVSNVTNMDSMFDSACHDVQFVDLSPLSNWNVSNVRNMDNMFAYYSYSSDIDFSPLSNWDVSNVTTMEGMFQYAGYDAYEVTFPTPFNWNTSNVTNMNNMFKYTGYNARQTWTLNLSNWDVSNVETHENFIVEGETRITLPTAWQ